MAIHLGRILRGASCNQPGQLVWKQTWAISRPRRPYSVLLPVGFALPPLLPKTRCALTAPFHPYPPSPCGLRTAVCFLWHFPWGRPRRRLSGTVLPRSPDFPPCPPIRWQLAERPSGLLTKVIRDLGSAPSSLPKDHAGQALNAMSAMARRSLRVAPPEA